MIPAIRQFLTSLSRSGLRGWKRFRMLALWVQGLIVAALLALVIGGITLAGSGSSATSGDQLRTVTVSSVGSLAGTGGSVSVIGTVRSVAEAQILAQAGGTVRSVHTSIGKAVPAGFVVAELDNASEAAAVLQAQGAYEGALAARTITSLQSGNSASSYTEAQASARDTYRSAYTTIDSTLTNDVDQLFGQPTPLGPQLLVNESSISNLPQRRAKITAMMETWRASLASADSTDPLLLLTQATQYTQTLSLFLNDLNITAADRNSKATPAQLAAVAAARATVNGELAALSAARDALNAKRTAAQVGSQQSVSSGAQTASADATVKQALGALRAAQAAYERTVVRAPIGGTVNFLPIRVGDYVTAFTHVATVAQNGALEIVSYVSENDRQNISVGMKVMLEDKYPGVVTSIAPALDPSTKQIEVHIAVTGTSPLIDGQTVRISFPTALAAPTTPVVAGPTLLPLTAVKLSADKRIVFTVGADGRLVAHPVEIGDVRGDRIEITSGVTNDLMIVTDARGLADGEKVLVASSTNATI